MEPVILLVSITAILSGTYIRAKKISLEKERMRLMAGGGQMSIMEQPAPKRNGFFRRAKSVIPPININTKGSNNEVEELKKRLENLETIVVDNMDATLVNGTAQRIQDELKEVSSRLNNLER